MFGFYTRGVRCKFDSNVSFGSSPCRRTTVQKIPPKKCLLQEQSLSLDDSCVVGNRLSRNSQEGQAFLCSPSKRKIASLTSTATNVLGTSNAATNVLGTSNAATNVLGTSNGAATNVLGTSNAATNVLGASMSSASDNSVVGLDHQPRMDQSWNPRGEGAAEKKRASYDVGVVERRGRVVFVYHCRGRFILHVEGGGAVGPRRGGVVVSLCRE